MFPGEFFSPFLIEGNSLRLPWDNETAKPIIVLICKIKGETATAAAVDVE
jgi:hypothetical protein